METLLIKQGLYDGVYLVDYNGYKLSWFKDVEAAKQWCLDHGYKVRIEKE